MKSWAQGLKQWGLWLLGEGSLPDSRARKMLAGTLAAVAVLVAAGVLAVGGSSKTNTASHNSTNLATAVGSGSAGTDDSSDDSSGSSGSGGTTSGNTSKSGHSGHSSRGSHTHARTPHSSTKSTHSKTTHTLPSTGSNTAAGNSSQNYLPAIISLGQSLNPLSASPPPVNLTQLAAPNASSPGSAPAAAVPVAPPTAPSAPMALKATANRGWSRVSWSPVSDGGSAIVGYNVYTGTAPGAERLAPSNRTLISANSNSYTVQGLAVGRPYYFVVVAVNAIGSSPRSNEVACASSPGYKPVGSLATPVVGMASDPEGNGYWLANSYGAVSAHGQATQLRLDLRVGTRRADRSDRVDPRRQGLLAGRERRRHLRLRRRRFLRVDERQGTELEHRRDGPDCRRQGLLAGRKRRWDLRLR